MNITINIANNPYVQPTEIREEVVQMVCNILLEKYLDNIPLKIYDNDGMYLSILKKVVGFSITRTPTMQRTLMQ